MSLDVKFELLSLADARRRLDTPEDKARPRTLVVFAGADSTFGETTGTLTMVAPGRWRGRSH